MNTDRSGGFVIAPGGDIVASMAVTFKEKLRDAVREHPGGLTIDMAGVGLIDSVGLGLLVATHNSLSKAGGKLTLVNTGGDVLSLLRAMRLDKHFQVVT